MNKYSNTLIAGASNPLLCCIQWLIWKAFSQHKVRADLRGNLLPVKTATALMWGQRSGTVLQSQHYEKYYEKANNSKVRHCFSVQYWFNERFDWTYLLFIALLECCGFVYIALRYRPVGSMLYSEASAGASVWFPLNNLCTEIIDISFSAGLVSCCKLYISQMAAASFFCPKDP